ncbi:hypothetical protein F2Q70_00034520 [Brassica cretica]|uniref:BHLH domain-containing protein n=1 Tax=Brassica cretica TaxID=69181 RepID=A0A8S9JXY6_BRACR|nr:hypothetical protein F2Q70_00034520 [Brassica cretica]
MGFLKKLAGVFGFGQEAVKNEEDDTVIDSGDGDKRRENNQPRFRETGLPRKGFGASVAIHGYVDAIQLVLLAAIPQLKEEITQSERTVIVDSESESENPNEDLALEGDNAVPLAEPSEATKYCLIPGHAKSIDIECQVTVKSIIDEPYEEWSTGLDFSWVDESEDSAVENLVRLIGEGFSFCKEMFKGGLNASDLLRLRGVKKLKEKEPKEKNDKDHAAEVSGGIVKSKRSKHEQAGSTKAVSLDEIINYVQSLERQVELLYMKLATINPRMESNRNAALSIKVKENMLYAIACSEQRLPLGYYSLAQNMPRFSDTQFLSNYGFVQTKSYQANNFCRAEASSASITSNLCNSYRSSEAKFQEELLNPREASMKKLEAVRREKISEMLTLLQDLVPGSSRITGKSVSLDEIINYVQSLERQVELLYMKLATINPRMESNRNAALSIKPTRRPPRRAAEGNRPHFSQIGATNRITE